MGQPTFYEKIKEFIGEIAWKTLLWSHGHTEEQHFAIMDESYENNGWIRPLNIK